MINAIGSNPKTLGAYTGRSLIKTCIAANAVAIIVVSSPRTIGNSAVNKSILNCRFDSLTSLAAHPGTCLRDARLRGLDMLLRGANYRLSSAADSSSYTPADLTWSDPGRRRP